MRRDSHNARTSKSMILPIAAFTGGGLWVRDPYVIEDTKVPKNLPNDQLVDGRSLELNNSEVEFNPRERHEVQPSHVYTKRYKTQ